MRASRALQQHAHTLTALTHTNTHGSHNLEDSCRGVEVLGKWIMDSGQSTSSAASTCFFCICC